MNRLNPLNDYIFQKLLGEKGDEEQLISFLNAILKRTGKNNIASVEIIENKKLTAEVIGDKTSILDIRAVTNEGTKVNIEVQLRNFGNMDRRSLFYWSREYSKGIEAGQDYRELPNVIAINIVNFEYIPIDSYHTSFHLWEDSFRDYMLTDALEIHFVDMIKFRRIKEKDIKNNQLHRWLAFFDRSTPEEVLEEVLGMDAAIQKAHEKVNYLSSDKEALRYYEMREMALSDYTSGMNTARTEGKIEGKIETAKNALKEGLPLDLIQKLTGLSASKINELRKK